MLCSPFRAPQLAGGWGRVQSQVPLASLLLFLRLPVAIAPERSCSSAESPEGLLRSEEGVGSYKEDAAKLPSAGPSAPSPTDAL